jgi:addiction module RelE/StbE family toxin
VVKRKLVRTNGFVRAAKRYVKKNPQSANDIEAALAALEQDAHNSRLRTHKLKGNLDGFWACSAGYDLRIVFELTQFEGKEAILLLTVGTHDEVY